MPQQEQGRSQSMRRLALFLDGTWNTVKDNTNVWRAKLLCARNGLDAAPQLAYYSQGVGTHFGERFRGGFFGYGIDQEITDAYEWLIENYSAGDQVFVFGFSRGAYTARSLSGLVSRCGLLLPGAPLSVSQIFARYRNGDAVRTIRSLLEDSTRPAPEPQSEDAWIIKYSRPVDIHFMGVWDTVGSLGIPDVPWIKWGREPFLDTNLRTSEAYAFHAVAIDEHREAFAPTLWTKYTPNDPSQHSAAPRPLSKVEQRWFIGAHANVGGGYVNDLLAQRPLDWLLEKATSCGLAFASFTTSAAIPTTTPITDSFAKFAGGFYKTFKRGIPYLRTIARPQGSGKSTTHETINETIDRTVFERWNANSEYRPQNLLDWSKRYGMRPEDIRGSVLARQPITTLPD